MDHQIRLQFCRGGGVVVVGDIDAGHADGNFVRAQLYADTAAGRNVAG